MEQFSKYTKKPIFENNPLNWQYLNRIFQAIKKIENYKSYL